MKKKYGGGRIFQIHKDKDWPKDKDQPGKKFAIKYYSNGRGIREFTRSADRRVAEDLLKLRLAEVIKVGNPDLLQVMSNKITLGEMRDALISNYKLLKNRSLPTAEHFAKRLIEFFGESKRARQLGMTQVEQYVAKRRRDGVKDSTINRETSCLRHMFMLMVKAKRLSHDDVPHIERLEEPETIGQYADPERFALLVASLPDYLREPVRFSYLCGWRIGAVRTLRWTHLNLERNRDGAIVGGDVTLEAQYSKNGKSYTIPLVGGLLPILQGAWDARDPGCEFVFHRNGRRIGDIRKSWYKATVAAGLQVKDAPVGKRFRFHDLRDCAATNLNDAGIGDRDAMMITGHRTTAMFDRYVRRQRKNIATALETVSARNDRLAGDTNVVAFPKRRVRFDKAS